MHAGHKVLTEVDNYILLIVGDLRGFLDKQLRSGPITLLNTYIIIFIYFIKQHIIKSFNDYPIKRQTQKT